MDADRAKRALWMAGLVVLGFLLRTTNAAEVFVGDAVVFPGNDPYYQVHRVLQALSTYPWVPAVDPLLDHPHGAAPIWPPLFPWGLATLARVLGHTGSDPVAVEVLLAVTVPVLGALVCVPVYALGRRMLDEGDAWVAAALSVLVPAHLWYSRLGFVDHHAAVTLVQVWMFLAALVAVRGGRGWGLLASLVVGMLLWNGFILFVAVLDAYLFALLLLEADLARRRDLARLVAWTHGATAVLIVPWIVSTVRATGAPWGTYALSYLHPAVLAGVAGLAGGIALAPRRALRWLAVVGALAVVGGVAAGVSGDVLGWVFARDGFMSSIQEVVPVFLQSDGSLDLATPTVWLTRFWWVTPILLLVVARRATAENRVDPAALLMVVWGTALFVLTLRQRRFAESFAPALAILVAWGLGDLRAWIRRRLDGAGWRVGSARVVAWSAVVVVLLYGLGPYYEPLVRRPGGLLAIAWAGAESPGVRELPAVHRSLRRLAEIATQQGDDETNGVVNLWPLGHHVLYLTKLPVVAGPFGSHLGGDSFDDASRFFLETDEPSAVRLLDGRRVRWVVVDNDLGTIGAALRARGDDTTAFYRKHPLADGGQRIEYLPPLLATMYLRFSLAGAPDAVPALEHFRLVVDAERDHDPGHPKVFERVEGARLVVEGAPGQKYVLRYAFRSPAGRNRVFTTSVRTDPAGRGAVRLPYSSERPDLGHDVAWEIHGPDGRVREVRVPERAVRTGEDLAVSVGSEPRPLEEPF